MAEQVLDTLQSRLPDLIKIIEHYGWLPQQLKCVEELSECAARISRDCVNELMKSKPDVDFEAGALMPNETLSEIADALIMLCQMSLLTPQKISEFIDFKIDRTLKAIGVEK